MGPAEDERVRACSRKAVLESHRERREVRYAFEVGESKRAERRRWRDAARR